MNSDKKPVTMPPEINYALLQKPRIPVEAKADSPFARRR